MNSSCQGSKCRSKRATVIGKIEPPRPGAAGIDVQLAAALAAAGLVRMATDYDVKPGSGGIKIERAEIVQHIDHRRVGLRHGGLGQRHGPRLRIHVAAHGHHRRQLLERGEDLGTAHVSRVDDQIGPAQRAHRLITQQAVRVRDNAHARGGEVLPGARAVHVFARYHFRLIVDLWPLVRAS